MNEQWQELKETIIEMRDNDGTGTQQETCKFLANLMDVLEKQMKDCGDVISREAALKPYKDLNDEDTISVWLIRKNIEQQPPVNPQEPKTGHCKDCKWWKDSDGVFRRGIGAESQCPMNRIEVYEGNGYCHMFEPQESEE